MRLTLLGKLVLLILALGIAVGGWRWWQSRSGASPGAASAPVASNPGGTGASQSPWSRVTGIFHRNTTGGGSGSAGSGSAGPGDILFDFTAAKQAWMQAEIDRFNAAHSGQWHITSRITPSREAMHDILSGRSRPVLWSPDNIIWASRLGDAWAEQHGDRILDTSDPNGFRVYLRSPLVFLTTRDKAPYLRPLLGGTQPWAAIRRLSLGRIHPPWGTFRFSHADPLVSNSGILTLGLILIEYGQQAGQGEDPVRMATDRRFVTYLKELEKRMVYDAPAQAGTGELTKAFLADPSRYDFITAYESAALEAAPTHPDIAVIYPNPTGLAENAVSLLKASWVTDAQREGALAFLSFLDTPESQQNGLKFHFRPAQSGGSLSLSGELDRYRGQGFRQSFTQAEMPDYAALNAAAYQWRIQIVHRPPSGPE